MSRPEASAGHYGRDYVLDGGRPPPEAGRGLREGAHVPREYGHMRDFSREGLRDAVPRDFGPAAPGLYGGALTPDRRPLTSGPLGSAGFSSFVAPRMFGGAQGIGGGGSDNWPSKPGSFTAPPPTNRQSGDASAQLQQHVPSLAHNHHHHHHPQSSPSPPRGAPVSELYNSNHHPAPSQFDRDPRDIYLNQPYQQTNQPPPLNTAQSLSSPTSATPSARTTLWWGDLEPWMDEEYAKQVCNLMMWEPTSIKVPRPPPDPVTGQQANNPGYCFLTFPTQVHATTVLSQINSSNNSGGPPLTMPNSSKPFSLNWASSVPAAIAPQSVIQPPPPPGQNPQYPKEYSIFVGDLAPEVSNSDLVAVFRNPVLGLRNDREPRFIRPFLSCKSAKIMLDPVTGVSRGYGFVRFTDESDQQRALVEMHGLYCLSRPMRISPATAKFKPAPGTTGVDMTQMPFNGQPGAQDPQGPVTLALPIPSANQTKSVSAPLANGLAPPSNSASSLNSAGSLPSLAGSSVTSSSTLASFSSDDASKTQYGGSGTPGGVTPNSAGGSTPSVSAPYAQPTHDQLMAQKYNMSEESWKHHSQARAILSNLIGPNGEQLTSSDPYNTTVFVGGLSPLISEETLRTFFAPFGEIHYVKVPVGKHCGFVQFVRKPDAERAIEKMQGFPIGGSRIRLSWGRSQYKAAQAAAQAAQAAAFQPNQPTQPAPPQTTAQTGGAVTPEQALQLLEKLGITNLINNGGIFSGGGTSDTLGAAAYLSEIDTPGLSAYPKPSVFGQLGQQLNQALAQPRQSGNIPVASNFFPFSPDPSYSVDMPKEQQPLSASSTQSMRQPGKPYAPWYVNQDEKVPGPSGRMSPSQAIRPPSRSQRFLLSQGGGGGGTSPSYQDRTTSRQDGPVPISRPDVARRSSQSHDNFPILEQEPDTIQDLNGTLASLNLDSQGIWKNGTEGAHALPTSP